MKASRPRPSRKSTTSIGSIRKGGSVKVVVDDFVEPNGICFSPDEKKLYVIDTGFTDGPHNPSHIRVFDVDLDNGKVSNGKVFCGNAEAEHHRWDARRSGRPHLVLCRLGRTERERRSLLYPGGELLGKIHIPETVANLSFGGHVQRNRLYICGSTSLYAVYTSVQGALKP